LRTILRRHNTVVETMAEALIELKQSRSQGLELTCERNIQVNSHRNLKIISFSSIFLIAFTWIGSPFGCSRISIVSWRESNKIWCQFLNIFSGNFWRRPTSSWSGGSCWTYWLVNYNIKIRLKNNLAFIKYTIKYNYL
jgi:hypothetical protein